MSAILSSTIFRHWNGFHKVTIVWRYSLDFGFDEVTFRTGQIVVKRRGGGGGKRNKLEGRGKLMKVKIARIPVCWVKSSLVAWEQKEKEVVKELNIVTCDIAAITGRQGRPRPGLHPKRGYLSTHGITRKETRKFWSNELQLTYSTWSNFINLAVLSQYNRHILPEAKYAYLLYDIYIQGNLTPLYKMLVS